MQLLSFTKTTLQRMAKAGHYLLRGDVSGLGEEINQYRQWKQIQQLGHLAVDLQKHVTPPAPLHNTESVQLSEAEFWDQVDISEVRQVSWSSAGGDVLGKWALEKMTGGRYEKINDLILDHIRAEHAELVGLVLGCGDMTGEQPYFTDPRFPFAKVDAIDISTASMERAKVLTDSVGLNVNYIAADVNHLELEPSTYDLIILFHAYHHFEEVDHIAQISNNALKPGGVFFTVDYIGAPRIQWTPKQLSFAQQILRLLPPKYRREQTGQIREVVQSVPVECFSPDEAICANQIVPAIAKHLDVAWQYNWAGLLMPLLEGIAFNFQETDEDHQLLRFLFDLDYALCLSGTVDPNFTFTPYFCATGREFYSLTQ